MPVTFEMKVTIPANTAKSAAVRDERNVQRGWYLKEVRLHVPSGHAGLQPVWFEKGNTPVVPTDGNEIALDNVPDLPIPVGQVMERDTTFALVGYNTDTGIQHTTRALVTFVLPGEEGYPGAR